MYANAPNKYPEIEGLLRSAKQRTEIEGFHRYSDAP